MVEKRLAASAPRMHYQAGERRRWMRVLAGSNVEELSSDLRALRPRPVYEVVCLQVGTLSGADRGASSKGRIPEVTRCVVRLANGMTGTACLSGSRPGHAELAAVFDALLKIPERYDELMATVIVPIESMTEASYNDVARVDPGANQGVMP